MVGASSLVRGVHRVVAANLGGPRHYIGRHIPRRDDFTDGGETVLLIHGFWQTRRTMSVLESRLRADGFHVLSFHLGGFLGNFNSRSIPALAQQIASKLERLSERGDFGTLHIVGHSKGGLVGRYLVARLGWHTRVRTLITLGSPHHGTPTAVLGMAVFTGLVSRSVWQMLPHSRFMRDLHDHPIPATTRLVSIYSRADLVCPHVYSEVTTADAADAHNLVVQGLGHMELVDDPWIYGLIVRQLRRSEVDGGEGDRAARPSADVQG